MNAQIPLTDEAIRAAFARRATSSGEHDLRERVLAASFAVPQRRGWRVQLDRALALPERRAALTLVAAVALLLAAALVVALVGSWINRPAPASLGRLAYLSDGDLYVAGPDGTSPTLIWDLAATEDLAQRQLVWVDPATVLLHNWGRDTGVFVVDVASGARRLLDAGQLVALSPDRTRIATLAYEEGANPRERLRLIDIASGALTAEVAAPIRAYPHSWSPDGRWLLGEMPEHIYKVDVASGELTVLAENLCCGLSPHSPAWSPDGASVVYVDYHLPLDEAGVPRDCDFRCGTLWKVAAAGGEPGRLTPELGSEIQPVISPDGQWIAYLDEQLQALTLIAADGAGRRVITPDWRSGPLDLDTAQHQFHWDPDAGGLTYLSPEGTLWHVTVGGVATRIEAPAMSEFARLLP